LLAVFTTAHITVVVIIVVLVVVIVVVPPPRPPAAAATSTFSTTGADLNLPGAVKIIGCPGEEAHETD
jgi:hypothetical protein